MNKRNGAIFLIAGTSIGSGMIALPMVLSKIGIIPSCVLLFITWMVAYYNSLLSVELNLKAGKGLSLGSLCAYFSGPIASFFGNVSINVLSYSLIAAYIYLISSVFSKMIGSQNMHLLYILFSGITFLLLLFPIKIVDYVNRCLFITLLCLFAVLLIGIVLSVNLKSVPLYGDLSFKNIMFVIPVVFTSFGFQVIFHTLTDYLNKDSKMLKKAFFLGSLIPMIVYILWSCSSISVIYNHNIDFFNKMSTGSVDVGSLVEELSKISNIKIIHLLVWAISFLSIITSIIGVAVGLFDSLNNIFKDRVCYKKLKAFSAFLVVVPSYIIASMIPNAFIVLLGFAGMILAVIAIILPCYLILNTTNTSFYYPILKHKILIYISIGIGILIIAAEYINMYAH